MNRLELGSIVVIAVSLLVLSIRLLGTGEGPASEPVGPAAAGEDVESSLDRLERELLRVRLRNDAIRARVASGRDSPAPDRRGGPAAEDERESPPDPAGIPEKIREAARILGVPDDALRAAYRLEMATRQNRTAPGAQEEFIARGADGFIALLAVIRGGLRATWQRDWLKKTYAPGLERHLLDLAEEPGRHQAHALSLLSVADTPEVRDYLVAAVTRYDDPARVYRAAGSLGRLKEPRGAAPLEGKFVGKDWGGVRDEILVSIGSMGGPDAERILTAWVRDEQADMPGTAVYALSLIDPEAARREAKSILAGDRARFIDGSQTRILKQHAGEK